MHMIHKEICHDVVRDENGYLRLDIDGQELWLKWESDKELRILNNNESNEMEDWFQDIIDE